MVQHLLSNWTDDKRKVSQSRMAIVMHSHPADKYKVLKYYFVNNSEAAWLLDSDPVLQVLGTLVGAGAAPRSVSHGPSTH